MHDRKHIPPDREAPQRPDPHALLASQSLAGAAVAGVFAIAVMCALWTALTVATGRVFPWFTVFIGIVIGLAVRRFGRGFDYRFPLLAALLAGFAALLGNLVIALPETMRELEAGAWAIVRGLTWRSFELFFEEVINGADYIYAGFASALAAFYSRRPLDRGEIYVLRKIRTKEGGK